MSVDMYRSLSLKSRGAVRLYRKVLLPDPHPLYWRLRAGGQNHGLVQGSGVLAHIVIGRFILHGSLDAVGQEAEDGPNPQQDGEAPEKLATELDPLRGGRGWGEGIGSIPSQNVLGPLVGEALREARRGVGAELASGTSQAPHHFPPAPWQQNNVQVERKIPPGRKG